MTQLELRLSRLKVASALREIKWRTQTVCEHEREIGALERFIIEEAGKLHETLATKRPDGKAARDPRSTGGDRVGREQSGAVA